MSRSEKIKMQANFIINNKSTVRDAAKVFGISKSTIHCNVTKRLEKIDPMLYLEVRKVLDKNKAERAIRGGQATKKKYLKLRQSKET